MLNRKSNPFALLGGIAIALVVSYQGYLGYQAMSQKAEQQKQLLQGFREWQSMYRSLAPVQASWDESFPEAGKVQDIYAIHQLLAKYGEVDADELLVTQLTRVQQGETQVGLTKICLTARGAMGVTLKKSNVAELLDSLKQMARSPSLEFSKVVLRANDKAALAELQSLCVLVRDPSFQTSLTTGARPAPSTAGAPPPSMTSPVPHLPARGISSKG